jgi:hypothetical protein
MKKQSVSSRPKKKSCARFDPFNNRLARDIRNTLSAAFVDAMLQVDKSRYQRTAEQWLARNLDDVYAGYIKDRLKRYGHVFDQIKLNRINDAKLQALIIWNHGLFFEVHEHLERIWQKTTDDEYQALKGLIQAAGVYIHLKFNHRPAAERLAIKSSDRIQKYSDCLTFIANLNLLLEKLKNLDIIPPQLKNPQIRSDRT